MSSEYLEDVECDDFVVLLTMRASGFANLTIIESDAENTEGTISRFPLYPNKQGLENAKKIINALKAWTEHIQAVGLMEE